MDLFRSRAKKKSSTENTEEAHRGRGGYNDAIATPLVLSQP